MSRAGFYSDNELRAYPLVNDTSGIALPDSVLVDFGCIVGPLSGFIYGIHKVWLYRVHRGDGIYVFEFRCDAPGLTNTSLSFAFEETAPEYALQFGWDDIASGSVSSLTVESCSSNPLWEGFLVIGQLSSLANVIDSGEELIDYDALTLVEPALIQNLDGLSVLSINLANKARTLVTAPEGCSSVSSDVPEEIFVQYRCMAGDIQIEEGYNCVIRVNAADNFIRIGARVGGGVGEPCEEVATYGGETPPDAGTLLTGGPTCSEIITSIDGIGGTVFNLIAGTGIRIAPGLDPYTISIEADMHGLALCVNSSVGGG